jgi:hypothetical protein
MQSETGCKINVSQASGADIEREIGLVGTRQAIDDAKRAIWEKVDQVVSLFAVGEFCRVLIRSSERRTTHDDVTTETRITDTHISRHLRTDNLLRPRSGLRRQHPLLLLVLLALLTHTLYMAATRTTLQCGMRPSLSNNRVVKEPKDLQAHKCHLVAVTDAHLAELRRMLPVCMTDAWNFAAPGMIYPMTWTIFDFFLTCA